MHRRSHALLAVVTISLERIAVPGRPSARLAWTTKPTLGQRLHPEWFICRKYPAVLHHVDGGNGQVFRAAGMTGMFPLSRDFPYGTLQTSPDHIEQGALGVLAAGIAGAGDGGWRV